MRPLLLALLLAAPLATAGGSQMGCDVGIDGLCVIGWSEEAEGEGDCDGARERHAHHGASSPLGGLFIGTYEGCSDPGAQRSKLLLIQVEDPARLAYAEATAGDVEHGPYEGARMHEHGAWMHLEAAGVLLLAAGAENATWSAEDETWDEQRIHVDAAGLAGAGAWRREGGPHGRGCVAYAHVAGVGPAPGCSWLGPFGGLLFP